jgi:hypothetical protein
VVVVGPPPRGWIEVKKKKIRRKKGQIEVFTTR